MIKTDGFILQKKELTKVTFIANGHAKYQKNKKVLIDWLKTQTQYLIFAEN